MKIKLLLLILLILPLISANLGFVNPNLPKLQNIKPVSSSSCSCSYNASAINESFVPYTGATSNVDLGSQTLTTSQQLIANVFQDYSTGSFFGYDGTNWLFQNPINVNGLIKQNNINVCLSNGTNCQASANYQFTNNNFNGSGNFTTSGNIIVNKINNTYNHFYFTPVPRPNAPTATIAEGGTLAGDSYKYWISFVTSTGETELSPVSNTVTTSGTQNKTLLTNIPIGNVTGVTYISRKIYRTKTSGYWTYYLATISNNVNTTYTDDGSVATSGAAYVPDQKGISDTTAGIIYKGTNKAFQIGLNTFVGEGAGQLVTTASSNTVVGRNALPKITTTARYVTAIGNDAMYECTSTNDGAVSIGYQTFYSRTIVTRSTALGISAGSGAGESTNDIFIGYLSGNSMSSTQYNLIIGDNAGNVVSGGGTLFQAYNILIGKDTGRNLKNNSIGNLFLGNYAGRNETGSRKLIIDSIERGSINAGKNSSIIYGEMSTNVQTQNLTFNANTIVNGNLTVNKYLIISNASIYTNLVVCYLAGGTLGHCTSVVGIDGSCTCVAN